MRDTAQKTPRIGLLDALRGVALIAMAIFHFNFDLELFGLAKSGYISQPHWIYFARVIAASFLILVGYSLALAHKNGIRWRGFWIRWAKVAGAAGVITIATYFATPDMFIFFGILHQIALASLLGLVFLRIYWLITGLIAQTVLMVGISYKTELLDAPYWWWTGLSEIIPRSSDYVPVFPWFGWVLVGIALANAMLEGASWIPARLKVGIENPHMSGALFGKLANFLQLLGRNSLLFYLAHQPIMISLIYVYLQIMP